MTEPKSLKEILKFIVYHFKKMPGRLSHLLRHRLWIWEDNRALYCRLCNNELLAGKGQVEKEFEEFKGKQPPETR